MKRNYFAILGITSSASPDEIRAAYRRLAKEFHPDHFTGGSEPFLKIQEAYSVLGDPHKREEYERSLRKPSAERPVVNRRPGARIRYSTPEPLIPTQRPVDARDASPLRSFSIFTQSLDQMFNSAWDNFLGPDWPISSGLENMTLEIPLTMEQATRGGRVRVMVPSRVVCPVCRGHGSVGFYGCSRCDGEGAVNKEVPVSLSFPAGLREDYVVAIPLHRFGMRNLRLTVSFRLPDNLFY